MTDDETIIVTRQMVVESFDKALDPLAMWCILRARSTIWAQGVEPGMSMTGRHVVEGPAEHIGTEELWNDFISIHGEGGSIYIPLGMGRRIGEHPLVEALDGKRVRVTIEVVEDGEQS